MNGLLDEASRGRQRTCPEGRGGFFFSTRPGALNCCVWAAFKKRTRRASNNRLVLLEPLQHLPEAQRALRVDTLLRERHRTRTALPPSRAQGRAGPPGDRSRRSVQRLPCGAREESGPSWRGVGASWATQPAFCPVHALTCRGFCFCVPALTLGSQDPLHRDRETCNLQRPIWQYSLTLN